MSRRRQSNIELSMFPFLSVLCAVIGVLMLFMVVIISTRVIGAEETSGNVETFTEHRESDTRGIEAQEYEAIEKQIHQLTALLIERRKEYEGLWKSHEQLRELITAAEDQVELGRPDAPLRARPIGLPKEVLIVPDATQEDTKKPIFVEVRSEAFIVHPEETQYALHELTEVNSPLQQFLQDVYKKRASRYLLLLIHPDGVEAHRKLRKYLLENHSKTLRTPLGGGIVRITTISAIDVGVEPFSREWLLIPSQ